MLFVTRGTFAMRSLRPPKQHSSLKAPTLRVALRCASYANSICPTFFPYEFKTWRPTDGSKTQHADPRIDVYKEFPDVPRAIWPIVSFTAGRNIWLDRKGKLAESGSARSCNVGKFRSANGWERPRRERNPRALYVLRAFPLMM